MTDELEDIGGGAGLWRRARAPWRAAQGAPSEPDAMTFAAYLEGRLDEAAAEAVEVWMAAESEAQDTVLAARAALAVEDPAPAPAHMVARAQGAVRGRGSQASGANTVFGALLGPMGDLLRPRPAAWAGAAAALLLASISGFELGRAGAETMATLDATVSQDLRLVMGRNGSDLL